MPYAKSAKFCQPGKRVQIPLKADQLFLSFPPSLPPLSPPSPSLSPSISPSLPPSLQLIEAEMKSKEKVYDHFMKGVDSEPKTLPDTETESEFNGDQREDSASPEPLLSPVVAALEFNPPQGVKFNDEKVMERRKRRNEMRNAVAGMESVQEQSGEEDEGNGTETPHVAEEPEDDSTISTPRNSLHGDAATERKQQSGGFDWAHRRYHSVDHTSLPKQPSIPLPIPPPPSSLHQTSTQSSLLSSLSSLDLGSRSLLSRQVSLTSSVTTSLAELLEMGSPTASMPDDLYQLMLLWNGIKMAIGQKRQRLEQIRDLWKSFEEKKEEFVNFLTLAEKRLREFPETLGRTMDISVIQNEIETQKVHVHVHLCRNEEWNCVTVTGGVN